MSFNIHTSEENDENSVYAPTKTDISHIYEFLGTSTPQQWLDAAIKDLPTIIQDHANCEKKAAGTAMNLVFRYEFHRDLQLKLAQLIREEMLHYEQVVNIMEERGQKWTHLPAGRYAKGMLKYKRTYEPAAMIDVLIIGAFIEARSCERFAALSEIIDDERLAKYYRYLLKSESRHYEDYIMLARSIEPKLNDKNTLLPEHAKSKSIKSRDTKINDKAKIDFDVLQKTTNGSINQDVSTMKVDERIAFFREIEANLIMSPDNELRFHSGIPSSKSLISI